VRSVYPEHLPLLMHVKTADKTLQTGLKYGW